MSGSILQLPIRLHGVHSSTVFTVPLCDQLFMSRATEISPTVSAFFEALNLICISTADCLLWLSVGSVLIFLRTTRISKRSQTADRHYDTTKARCSQALRLLFSFKCLTQCNLKGLTTSSGKSVKFRTSEGLLSYKLVRSDSNDKFRCLGCGAGRLTANG
jgi:hypothetical protein